MRKVQTKGAPVAIGPYSQGIGTEIFVFSSGQLPLDPGTGQMPSAVADQTRQAMENVKAVLEAAGSSLENAVKATVFLQNLEDVAVVNEVYASFFSGTFPARSCVQVARLPGNALVEIEMIAVK